MDVVYIVKEDPENNSEDLRYSLRSLKNLKHNKVVIAGEKPSWVTNVEYLPVIQDKSKSENWKNNLQAALDSPLVSDDFILMNDDFFIMKQIDAIPNLNLGPMEPIIELYKERYPESTEYIEKMVTLFSIFKEQGIQNPISYELHTPMVLNKQKVIDMYRQVKGERLYQFRTRYGNLFNLAGEIAKDPKIFIEPRHNDPEYNEGPEDYMKKQTFLSTTGGSFKKGIAGQFVRNSFPEKSIYEI